MLDLSAFSIQKQLSVVMLFHSIVYDARWRRSHPHSTRQHRQQQLAYTNAVLLQACSAMPRLLMSGTGGNAFNQIAVLANMSEDAPCAAAFYCRAFASAIPFDVARDNLLQVHIQVSRACVCVRACAHAPMHNRFLRLSDLALDLRQGGCAIYASLLCIGAGNKSSKIQSSWTPCWSSPKFPGGKHAPAHPT